MISLQINGKYLDIEPDDKITIEWVSTAFNDDSELLGSYTYPIKLPFTPNNNILLGNAYLIENRSARMGALATLEVFGRPWKKGKLSFDVTAEGYEASVLIDNGEFARVVKEKLLPDAFTNFKNGVFDSFQYDVLGSNPTETLTTMVARSQTAGLGSCVFPPIINENLFGSTSGDDSTPPTYNTDYYLNDYHLPAADFLSFVKGADHRNRSFYTPMYYLSWVIQKVCNYLGFEAEGDFLTDPRTRGLIIDNTGFIDVNDLFADTGGKLAPARHLPAIKIGEFFKTIRAMFKVSLYFDGNARRAYFNYLPDLLGLADEVDISGYTEAQPYIKAYVPTGYELQQAVDSDDAMFKNFAYVKNYFIGDDEEPQKLDKFCGTLFMSPNNWPRKTFTTTYRVPRKSQVGNGYTDFAKNTDAFNETGYNKNDYAFRLLNYVGIRQDSGGFDYPYATADGKEPNGTVNPDLLSLWLGDNNGIINVFLKAWILFYLRTEEVELTAYLPGNILHQLSPVKKMVWTAPNKTRMPALLSKLSFETSDVYAERIAAKILAYPIYNQVASDVKAFTDFKSGEVENAGSIFVKLVITETSRDTKTTAGYTFTTAIYNTGTLKFYSDQACTKPRNVSNVRVGILYKYRGKNVRNYTDAHYVVVASGTEFQVQNLPDGGIGQTYKFASSDDYWTKYYSLEPITGADYEIAP